MNRNEMQRITILPLDNPIECIKVLHKRDEDKEKRIRELEGKINHGVSRNTIDGLLVELPPVYVNNAAAVAGGLTVGKKYRTGADPDPVCVVH
jgi:hypothetical protein